jgi:predicted nucleic acid-binding protein
MMDALEEFLMELAFEYFYTPQHIDASKYPAIRDYEDLPILVSSILAEVDVLVTGDKDFNEVKIEKPEILTPRKFMDKY